MMRIRSWVKWLLPGLGVKRWIFLLCAGTIGIGVGIALLAGGPLARLLLFREDAFVVFAGFLWILAGAGLVAFGVRGVVKAIAGALLPRGDPHLVEILSKERQLHRGPKIVAFGGGTGLSTLLRGLKQYTANITAVVTVFDDGGSSGRLRRELNILPPGDLRDCLVALAEVEPLMTKLFEYRFPGGALNGHAFGNLFIATMVGITGDLETAIQECSKVLNIRGRVLPATTQDVLLCAEFEDGTLVVGESNIPKVRKRIRRVFLEPPHASPLPEVLEAIFEADLLLLGPGSLYTSVIPNLLVQGMADAIRSAPGVKVYVCNVMTQPGETDGFTASDHVQAILDAAGDGLFTHVLVNGRSPQSQMLLRRYQQEGATPVSADVEKIRRMGFIPVVEDLISEEVLLRHDPRKLARAAIRLYRQVKAPAVGDRKSLGTGAPAP
ncbi:MAG: YvcK family protein [Armatimonadota bacterium]|nr:YvcK family protein [Armatimonadota bacterium]